MVLQHRARMAGARAQELLKRRKALAEHPFGTLKCRAGYRHFLVRGFAKVRGEWGLMALCYNLGRVLGIIGMQRFIARVADLCAEIATWLLAAVIAALADRDPHPARTPPRSCRYGKFWPFGWSAYAE